MSREGELFRRGRGGGRRRVVFSEEGEVFKGGAGFRRKGRFSEEGQGSEEGEDFGGGGSGFA